MTYSKQMQKIVQEYRLSDEPWPTSAKNIADWAIITGRWEMPAAAIRRRCAETRLSDAGRVLHRPEGPPRAPLAPRSALCGR